MKPKLCIRLAHLCIIVVLPLGCADAARDASQSQANSAKSVTAETVSNAVVQSSQSIADAGMTWEDHISGSPIGDIAISLPPKAIVVATVLASSNDKATYGHPPTIHFSVNQKILNDTVPDDIKVIWEPPPHDVDYNNIYDEPRYIEWSQSTILAPRMGERFILMLVDPQSKVDTTPNFSCPSIGRYSATNENIQKVLDALNTPNQNGG